MAYGVKVGFKGKVAGWWGGAGKGAWAGKGDDAEKDVTARYLLADLPATVTEDDLRMYFGQYSAIEEVTVKARNDGQIVGSVKFSSPDAELRQHMLGEPHELEGQPILVETWKMQKLKRPGYAASQAAKQVAATMGADPMAGMEWQLVPQLVPKGSMQGVDPWAVAKGFGKSAKGASAWWSGELDAAQPYGTKGAGKNSMTAAQPYGAKGAGKNLMAPTQPHGAKGAGKSLMTVSQTVGAKGAGKSLMNAGQTVGAKGAGKSLLTGGQTVGAKGAGKSLWNAGQTVGTKGADKGLLSTSQVCGAKGAGKSLPDAGQVVRAKGVGKSLPDAGQVVDAKGAGKSEDKDITARYLLVDLDPCITEEDLSNYFGTFGLIEEVNVKLVSGGTKIIGSVKFIEPTNELRNIMFQQTHEINGYPVTVQTWKMQKQQRPGWGTKVGQRKHLKGKGKGMTERWTPY